MATVANIKRNRAPLSSGGGGGSDNISPILLRHMLSLKRKEIEERKEQEAARAHAQGMAAFMGQSDQSDVVESTADAMERAVRSIPGITSSDLSLIRIMTQDRIDRVQEEADARRVESEEERRNARELAEAIEGERRALVKTKGSEGRATERELTIDEREKGQEEVRSARDEQRKQTAAALAASRRNTVQLIKDSRETINRNFGKLNPDGTFAIFFDNPVERMTHPLIVGQVRGLVREGMDDPSTIVPEAFRRGYRQFVAGLPEEIRGNGEKLVLFLSENRMEDLKIFQFMQSVPELIPDLEREGKSVFGAIQFLSQSRVDTVLPK